MAPWLAGAERPLSTYAVAREGESEFSRMEQAMHVRPILDAG
jgi:hypothetical protein